MGFFIFLAHHFSPGVSRASRTPPNAFFPLYHFPPISSPHRLVSLSCIPQWWRASARSVSRLQCQAKRGWHLLKAIASPSIASQSDLAKYLAWSAAMGDEVVFRAVQTSRLKSLAAVFVWLSAIHVVAVLALLMIFVLPHRWNMMMVAVLLILMVIPLYEQSPVAIRVAKFICKHGPGHFPLTCVVEDRDSLDPKRAYLFAVEPHSVLPVGILAFNNHTKYLPIQKLKALASSAIFLTPLLRHIWSWMGLAPASKKILFNLLSSGCSCVLIPGGVREMLFMEHDREVVFLKQRVGFIRIAIEAGSPIVPCFVFGQTRIYKWWKPRGKLYDDLCRILRFAPLVFWGMFGSPIPYRHPMHVVIGKPIEVNKSCNPTDEEVLNLQDVFITALKELYEKHKVKAGYKGTPLYIH